MEGSYYQIPAIHFQFMKDGKDLAKRLVDSEKSFIASIVPDLVDKSITTDNDEAICERIHSEDNYYPEWALDFFRENRKNSNIEWAQEGYRHCCGRCYDKFEGNGGREKDAWPDPFHEHVCLDGHAQSLGKQIRVIKRGKELLEKELGITPKIYCPPNHLYNSDTLKAAQKLGFNFFMARNGFDYFFKGKVDLPAYREDGLIIIPETKFGFGTTPVALTYYDGLNWDDLQNILKKSRPLKELPVFEKSRAKIIVNDKLIPIYKSLRDYGKQIKAFSGELKSY